MPLEDPFGSMLTGSPTLGLSRDGRRSLRRGALWVLLASLAVSALMGCIALIRGEFDDVEGRLLFSTFTVFGTSVTTLACGLAWERGRLGLVPLLGIALGLLFGLVMIVVIWAEPDVGEAWGKAYGTEIAVAVAATHASLVAVFATSRRSRGVSYVALGLNALAALLTIIAIWSEGDLGDGFWRFYGALMVVLIAVTIAVPVLRRLDGAPDAPASPARTPTPARFCPSCGVQLDTPGAGSCSECGAHFQVSITVV